MLGIVELQPLAMVLRRLASVARELTDADYAAIGAYDDEQQLSDFEAVGVSDDERDNLRQPPRGAGLLGEFARDPVTINIPDTGSHPMATGSPEGHPEMGAFLGVPVVYGSQPIGAFYVTRRPGLAAFSEEAQAQLESLAPYAAIAIRNAEALELERHRAETQASLDRHAVRDAVARDLHDDVIQSIYAVGLGLRAGRGGDLDAKNQAIDRASVELQAVIADLRAYITRLSADPAALDPAEVLVGRLRELVAQGGQRPAWTLDFEAGREADEPTLARQIYLIAREMISNVMRHAAAGEASLALRQDGRSLVMSVRDNGRGFDRGAVPEGAVGLRSIEQRVADLDGSLLIESEPGAGTVITATIPLSDAPED